MKSLKEFRKKANKTQAEVAQFLGVKQSYYNQMENGIAVISDERLLKIADYLNVTVEEIKKLEQDANSPSTKDNFTGEQRIKELEAQCRILSLEKQQLQKDLEQAYRDLQHYRQNKLEYLTLSRNYPAKDIRDSLADDLENIEIINVENQHRLLERYIEPFNVDIREEELIRLVTQGYLNVLHGIIYEITLKTPGADRHRYIWATYTKEQKIAFLEDIYDRKLHNLHKHFLETRTVRYLEGSGFIDTSSLFEKVKSIFTRSFFIKYFEKLLDITAKHTWITS